MLHEKAKEEPKRRFHALVDKVWRMDFLWEAWRLVRRKGGSAGVDGETIEAIEAQGVEAWLRELSQGLREGTYTPQPVRQVLIPKKRPGTFRSLGIPCLRDRVTQTSAILVLSPIFEADLQPEQYGYRPKRSAQDAVKRIHSLLNTGHREVIDADLSNYFGEIPHAELMKSVARRVSDGRMLGLIKAWLVMPVVEDDGKGGQRCTNRARKQRKGTPQGSPISPLLSNIYMRRFILGWKILGYAQHFGAEIVCYADDFVVLGRASAAAMLQVVHRLMTMLKLRVNTQKTRCLRCPDEPFEFLGYRIGWVYRHTNGSRYIGTRPSQASIQRICRRISDQTAARYGQLSMEQMVDRLNRMISGWANYFTLGQVSPAYATIDRHTTRRLRQWASRKHKMKSGINVHFSNAKLRDIHGLIHLGPKTKTFPWAKSCVQLRAGCGKTARPGSMSGGRKRSYDGRSRHLPPEGRKLAVNRFPSV